MKQSSCWSRGFILVSVGLVWGCATAYTGSNSSDGGVSGQVVEMVVLNRTADAVAVYAWWEGGARVELGELRDGMNATFAVPYRGTEIGLSLEVWPPRGGAGLDLDQRPESFVPVVPGDRIEWEIRSAAPVDVSYRRLPPE